MKKVLSALMCAVLILCSCPFFAFAGSEKYIEFGSYPQSRVTSADTLGKLNALKISWISYGYFSGNGSIGSAKSGDYMKYADISLDGEKYRAVLINDYRPMKTHKSNSSKTYQDDNGYQKGNIYWFKFEPLKWRVLDSSTGLMLCESIIDSQPFNNTVYKIGSNYYNDKNGKSYAHDYAESTLRIWLNDDFYNTAFTAAEKAKMGEYACTQQYFPRSKPHGEMTVYDRVFMLSRIEATSTKYGFKSSMYSADNARRASGTDYARCQGLHVCEIGFGHKGNSCWWLRAPAFFSRRVNKIFYDGYCAVDSYYMVELTDIGVRPCIILK